MTVFALPSALALHGEPPRNGSKLQSLAKPHDMQCSRCTVLFSSLLFSSLLFTLSESGRPSAGQARVLDVGNRAGGGGGCGSARGLGSEGPPTINIAVRLARPARKAASSAGWPCLGEALFAGCSRAGMSHLVGGAVRSTASSSRDRLISWSSAKRTHQAACSLPKAAIELSRRCWGPGCPENAGPAMYIRATIRRRARVTSKSPMTLTAL